MSQPRRAALVAAGQTVPNPVPVRALIDTGASHTCVDPTVLQPLNLTPTGSVGVNTPTTGTVAATRDQYDVMLLIIHPRQLAPLIRPAMPVICTELFASQGIHVLLGRDVLQECLLTVDGTTGSFILAY